MLHHSPHTNKAPTNSARREINECYKSIRTLISIKSPLHTHIWCLPTGEGLHVGRSEFSIVGVIRRVQLEVDDKRRKGIVADEVEELIRCTLQCIHIAAHEVDGELSSCRHGHCPTRLHGICGVLPRQMHVNVFDPCLVCKEG